MGSSGNVREGALGWGGGMETDWVWFSMVGEGTESASMEVDKLLGDVEEWKGESRFVPRRWRNGDAENGNRRRYTSISPPSPSPSTRRKAPLIAPYVLASTCY